MAIPLDPPFLPLQIRPRLLLQLVFLLLSPCFCHAPPSLYSVPSADGGNDGSRGATTAVMIAILLAVFFLTGFFFFYIQKRRNAIVGNTSAIAAVFPSVRLSAAGLDPAVIESFPTTVYSEVKGLRMGSETLECAVCLCYFEDDDTLTMLPRCSHAFHQECIGMWLSSHHTCPVCRGNLNDPVPGEPGPPAGGGGVEAERGDQVRIAVDEEEDRDAAAESGRMAGVRDRMARPWRSWSARAAVGGSWRMRGIRVWGEDERERFTLRLPENVRKKMMRSGSSDSSLTSARAMGLTFNAGEESRRMGYREGLSWGMGKSVRVVLSDRWASLLSSSSSFKSGAIGPLDRLRGGGSRHGNSGDGVEESLPRFSRDNDLDK